MPSAKFAAALVTFAAALTPCPAQKPAKHTNRLAGETSPYLRQHAHNPVDWYPWGAEAFETAKKDNKLVFLSIGYSSCHWCHVMERESFDNESVAKILNDNFVCIKVAREERPDIDEIYMTSLHVFGQRGGWPLSMFLTADAKPIIGGTYWPPEDRDIQGQSVKGFKSILKIMIDLKAKEPEKLTEQAEQVAKLTRQRLSQSRGKAIVALDRALVSDGLDEVTAGFDATHGGYGQKIGNFRGPKFPMPSYLELILAEFKRTKSDELHRQLTLTLTKMANGGIFDHLGGGFHRYSTERTWTVPHFEKMLYDNAQLVEVYSKMHEIDPNPLYERAVRETLAFIKREMTSPEGAFYSALDADSEGDEGRFYVWTPKELEAALTLDELVLAREVYGDALNFEEKATILTRNADFDKIAARRKLKPEELSAKLEPVHRKLFEARSKRPRPFLDTKVLAAWNGQMIAAFSVAGRVFKDKDYLAAASRAADFVLTTMRTKDGRLLRTYMSAGAKTEARLNGYLDDYAFVVHGLLALHAATLDERWSTAARELTDIMVKWFHDERDGGYFFTSHDHEKLFARSKDQYDGAIPSGNSVTALNFVRLFKATGSEKYRELARASFESFAGSLKAEPSTLTTMLAALGEYLDITAKVEAKAEEPKKSSGGAKKSDSVVKVTAEAEKPDAAGKQLVTVTLLIDDGWYTYANPVGNKDMEGTETTVKTAGKGDPKLLKVEYPKGTPKKDKVLDVDIEYLIYEGKVTIKATVQRAVNDMEPLELSVKFGACNKRGVCLLPATVKVPVK